MQNERIKKAIDLIKVMNQQEKSAVFSELLAELEPESDSGVEAAWQVEAQRRLNEVFSNQTPLLTWDEVKTSLANKSSNAN